MLRGIELFFVLLFQIPQKNHFLSRAVEIHNIQKHPKAHGERF
jgi:hypothetical protein